MYADATLTFSMGQSLAVSASTPSATVIDLTGAGEGTPPNLSWGNSATFGADLGLGAPGFGALKVVTQINEGLSTTNSATLNVALQGAPDDGSNEPGAWETFAESGPIAADVLGAGGQIVFDYPRRAIGAALPRFLQLLYQLPASTSFSAGAVTAAIILDPGSEFTTALYPAAFATGIGSIAGWDTI